MLSINIISACHNKVLFFLAGISCSGWLYAFQTDSYSHLDPIQLVESGQATDKNVPPSVFYLGTGNYAQALETLTAEVEAQLDWVRAYLTGLVNVTSNMERNESDHFILFTPPGQGFLATYALPALEKGADYYETILQHRPHGKIRVEIYPTQEDFSKASTLSVPILENSGAIGICKFHRLMIMSPQNLPLGYRWLDALVHEYGHLVINELTHTRMELWLHEGTARYLDTSWRVDPPVFLTPRQKSDLKDALLNKTFISFDRMSPSMVYLKNQTEVSLAFAEVSYAVSLLMKHYGNINFRKFLRLLKNQPFSTAFYSIYRMSPEKFESHCRNQLNKEDWPQTKGSMSDEIYFGSVDESNFLGASALGHVRLGDRMRTKGYADAALAQYEKALAQEPDNAVILLKVARCQLVLGQPKAAMASLQKAIETNPNYGTPYIELAGLVDPATAIKLYREANSINPFDPHIHAGLATMYKKMNFLSESQKEEELLKFLQKN